MNQVQKNSPQLDGHIISHLSLLKILHTSNRSLKQIKQMICTLKPKLPFEYERSIIQYCQNDKLNRSNKIIDIHMAIGVWIRAARMFKCIDHKNNLKDKIKEFQQFLEDYSNIRKKQQIVIMYNIAFMCQILSQNAKANKFLKLLEEKINQNGQALNQIYAKLQTKISLKLGIKQTSYKNKTKNMKKSQQLIQRYSGLTEVPFNIKNIYRISHLQLFQLYNLALVLKKSQKFRTALKFFYFVLLQIPYPTNTAIFCKINIAECQYHSGLVRESIMTLQNLLHQNNWFIQSYKTQIKTKINIWKQSQSLLNNAIIDITNNKKEVQNYLLKNQFDINKNTEKLPKNKKLIFMQQKFRQLEQLKTKYKKQCLHNIKQTYHKTQISLIPQLILYKAKKNKIEHNSKLKIPKVKDKKDNSQIINSDLGLNNLVKSKCQLAPNNSTFTSREPSSLNLMMKIKNQKQPQNKSFFQIYSQNQIPGISSAYLTNHTVMEQMQKAQQQKLTELINHLWALIKDTYDGKEVLDNYLILGDAYVKLGDFENGLAVYKKALQKGKVQANGRIANMYYNNYKFQLAIQYFKKYFASCKDEKDQQLIKLYHCYSKISHHIYQASDKLKNYLQQHPNNIKFHVLYVTTLMKQKNYSMAIQICQKFKQNHYICIENLHILGLLYKEIGEIKKAFNSFLAILKMDPYNVNALIEITQLSQISQFQPELIEIYKKIIKVNPQRHELLQIHCDLLSHNKINFSTIKPKLNFSQLILLGDFFLEKGMTNQAQISYMQAREYTNNTLLKQKLGNLQYIKNNYSKAQQYYKQSQKRHPMFKLQIKLSDTLLKQNKLEQAKQILQQCVAKQNENKSICLNMLGQCMFRLGNFQQALQIFQLSSKLNQNKKINQEWENVCRRKIMEKMKHDSLVNHRK